MNTKPEALQLADEIDGNGLESVAAICAAAELRRLHAEVERLTLNGIHSCHAECQRPVCRLTRERNALLEALKGVLRVADRKTDEFDAARAAIKAVKKNT